MGRLCIVLSHVFFSMMLVVRVIPALAAEPPAIPRPPAGGAAKLVTPVAALLQRAERARKAGRWAEAADAYRVAWEQDPRPAIAGELGAAEVAVGMYSAGAEHLDRGLEDPALLSDDQRRRFEQALAKAVLKVATVAISAHPPAAEVWINDRSLGAPAGSYIVYLDPGRYTFRARLDGYEPMEQTIDVQVGSAPMVALPLRARRPAPQPVPRPAPPLQCQNGAGCGGAVTTTLRYVGFGATGAALAVGAGMAIGARAVGAELDGRIAGRQINECWGKGTLAPCRDLTELRKARDFLASGALIGFMSAGAIGAATISSFWWAPDGRGAARVQVAPAVAGDHVGALVRGHW